MIHLINSDQRSLGVTFPAEDQVNIVFWAPLAKHVAIKIYGNQAAIPLKKEEMGYWRLTTSQLKPGDLYTYILDGHREYPDPTSLSQPQGVHGPSQAIDTTTFHWEDDCWVNPSLDSYVLYEIHTGLPEAGDAGVLWNKLLDSADSIWQPQPQSEACSAPETVSAFETIQVKPESISIYAQHHEKSRFHLPDPISQRLYLS